MASRYIDIRARPANETANQHDRGAAIAITTGASTRTNLVRVTWNDARSATTVLQGLRAIINELKVRGISSGALVP